MLAQQPSGRRAATDAISAAAAIVVRNSNRRTAVPEGTASKSRCAVLVSARSAMAAPGAGSCIWRPSFGDFEPKLQGKQARTAE
jgi:hypothetical protein